MNTDDLENQIQQALLEIQDENPETRRNAARRLGQLGDTRAVEPLITALKDREKGVGAMAAVALGQLGDDRASAPLLEYLDRQDDTNRRRIILWALGRMNDPLLADPLFKLVSTSEGILRFDAAIALARLGDDRAIATLREALNFPDEGIRLEVARLLEKLETN